MTSVLTPVQNMARLFFLALTSLLLLSGCAIQLVPDYDRQLVQGLNIANGDAMTLFAGIEDDASESTYQEYARDYNRLIGSFDALLLRAQSRDVPPLAKRLAKQGAFQRICPDKRDATTCLNASPTVLIEILSVFREMRAIHRATGLEPAIIELFKGRYVLQIKQVLQVENALER